MSLSQLLRNSAFHLDFIILNIKTWKVLYVSRIFLYLQWPTRVNGSMVENPSLIQLHQSDVQAIFHFINNLKQYYSIFLNKYKSCGFYFLLLLLYSSLLFNHLHNLNEVNLYDKTQKISSPNACPALPSVLIVELEPFNRLNEDCLHCYPLYIFAVKVCFKLPRLK